MEVEEAGLVKGNLIGRGEGMDFGQEKGVIGIDVADTGKTGLIVK